MADIIMAAAVFVGALAALILAIAGYKRAGRVEMKVGNVHGSVDFVAEQMTPNGGKSMRDAIDRIERGQNEARAEQAEIRKELVAQGLRLVAVEEFITNP